MRAVAVAVMALSLSACMSMGGSGPAKAPQPTQPVDAARFYSGYWHEIGRRPMWLTNGCVAGGTQYAAQGGADVQVLDDCYKGSRAGKRKTIGGPATIQDPGTNAKLRVRYKVFGLSVVRDYWVLEHDPDYAWFISADPAFQNLWIYTRDTPVTPQMQAMLVSKATALGYDVSRLEFPAQ